MSLVRKLVLSFGVSIGQQISIQAIKFIVQIWLARILLPEAFGLISLLAVFNSISMVLIDGGMTSSLIRSKSLDSLDYSSVFVLNAVMGIFFYCLIYISTLVFDYAVLGFPDLKVIRIYCLIIAINSFFGVHAAILTRELRFKTVFLISIPSVLISSILAIILAKMSFGYWSLVIMHLTNALIMAVLHWLVIDWKPSMRIDKNKVLYHFSYGYKLTLSSLVASLYQNTVRVIIGSSYSLSSLGLYYQANSMRMLIVNNLGTSINKVSFPILSNVMSSQVAPRDTYLFISKNLVYFSGIFVLFPVFFANELFDFILGPKWAKSAVLFQILGLSSFFYPASLVALNAIKASGRSDIYLKLELVKKAIGLAILLAMSRFGLKGIAFAVSVSMTLNAFINMVSISKRMDLGVAVQLRPLFVSGMISSTILMIVKLGLEKVVTASEKLSVELLSIAFIIIIVLYFLILQIFSLVKVDNLFKLLK